MIILWISTAGDHLFHSVRAKGLEWICTLAALLLGYALAQPQDTFALSSSYRTIEATTLYLGLTENMVGWSILGTALVRLAILAYNGLWTSSPIARRLLAYAFALLWFVLFVGFWSASGFSSTGSVFLAFLAGEIVNTIRTSWERGQILILDRGKVAGHAGADHTGH